MSGKLAIPWTVLACRWGDLLRRCLLVIEASAVGGKGRHEGDSESEPGDRPPEIALVAKIWEELFGEGGDDHAGREVPQAADQPRAGALHRCDGGSGRAGGDGEADQDRGLYGQAYSGASDFGGGRGGSDGVGMFFVARWFALDGGMGDVVLLGQQRGDLVQDGV